MAYPAGSLPLAGQIQDLSRSSNPFKSAAFAGGGSDLDLTDIANDCVPCATEFYCTVAGNLTARLAGDDQEQTYPVTVGQVLKGLFVLAKSSSTANGIFRQ